MKVIVYILINIWNFLVTRFTQREARDTLVGIGKKMRSHQAFPFSNHSFLYAVETFAVNGIFWLSWLTAGAG